MEVLVLGIDNSLIPVEISTCNEIHKYRSDYCTVKQVDSSLSKSRASISLTTNDITVKTYEKGLVTKECIATHTN